MCYVSRPCNNHKRCGEILGFFVYVWDVAPCITANEVPQLTTIQTENKELQNYRKFSLQLSEVGCRLKWSHSECTIGPPAGLQWSHSECAIGPLADKIIAGCDPDRHVATWSVLCMGLPNSNTVCHPSSTGAQGLVAHPVRYTSR
jgi:hypothetical protein